MSTLSCQEPQEAPFGDTPIQVRIRPGSCRSSIYDGSSDGRTTISIIYEISLQALQGNNEN